jgi:hypothetical protein
MARNLRLPAHLDRRVDELAAEEHMSKTVLLLQGAELLLRHIREGMDFVLGHDAELLKRFEDA